MKNYKDRPKYKKLLQHQFILKYEQESVDVGAWYKSTQRLVNLKEASVNTGSAVASTSNSLSVAGATSSSASSAKSGATTKPGISFDTTNLKPLPSPRTVRSNKNYFSTRYEASFLFRYLLPAFQRPRHFLSTVKMAHEAISY